MTNSHLFGKYSRDVHRPLAEALGDCNEITTMHVFRYSKKEDIDGLNLQIERQLAPLQSDPHVLAFLRMVELGAFESPSVFDPDIVWISAAMIHHQAADNLPTVAAVKIGGTLFLRVGLSAVKREIMRDDGTDANLFTTLILSLLSHLNHLQSTYWAKDFTRAARESVNFAQITNRHRERNVSMHFGEEHYDLSDKGGRVQLGVLNAVTAEDDPERRRKLVESKVVRYLRGEACLPREILPYGSTLPINEHGRVENGTIPFPDFGDAKLLQEVHTLYAKGETYRNMMMRLAVLEAEKKVTRRSGTNHKLTFADAIADGANVTLYAVIARLIRITLHPEIPSPSKPDQRVLDAYLAGGDPAKLFTLPQLLAIQRPEMVRTGRWLRVLRNDIRQRGLVLGGRTPIYFSANDDCGFFVLDCPWPWPIDPATGVVLDRFGLDDLTLRRSAVRILLGLSPASSGPRTGGRGRQCLNRRPFLFFGDWSEGAWSYVSVASPGAREGLYNSTILRRSTSKSGAWKIEKERHAEFAVATFRQQSLALDVANSIEVSLTNRILPEGAAPLDLTSFDPKNAAAAVEAENMKRRAAAASALADEAAKKAYGAREMASVLSGRGEIERALTYDAEASNFERESVAAKSQASKLLSKSAAAERANVSEVTTDLSPAAFVIAGLRRAAEDGQVSSITGAILDRVFDGWSLVPIDQSDPSKGKWIRWSVDFLIPMLDGTPDLKIPITGLVPNIRVARKSPILHEQRPRSYGLYTGPRFDHAAKIYLGLGKSMSETSTATRVGEHILMKFDLRKWLQEHSIGSTGLGIALIDHPLTIVRQAYYRAVSDDLEGVPANAHSEFWAKHIVETYSDESRKWFGATCPDELTFAHQIVATLTDVGPVAVDELARVLQISKAELNYLSTPIHPNCEWSFVRPRFVLRIAKSRAFTVIKCPHHRCGGIASHVVLVPETASSGFGVMCPKCRRMPNVEDPKWAQIVFPTEYLSGLWSAIKPRPEVGRTVTIPKPIVLDVAPFPRSELPRKYRVNVKKTSGG